MSGVMIGSAGVSLLLIAFVLNMMKFVSEKSVVYLFLNILGASLAGWYAYVETIYPFVLLESVWAIAALVRLLMIPKKTLV